MLVLMEAKQNVQAQRRFVHFVEGLGSGRMVAVGSARRHAELLKGLE